MSADGGRRKLVHEYAVDDGGYNEVIFVVKVVGVAEVGIANGQ